MPNEAETSAADDTAVPETTEQVVETPAPSEAENTEETTSDALEPEVEKTTEEATDDKPGEPAEATPAKKKNRVTAKDRISQLTKKNQESQDRVRELENRLEKTKVNPSDKPKSSDFDDPEDYADARAIYREKLLDRGKVETEVKTASDQVQVDKAATWQAQQEDARERYTDFDQVITAVPANVFTQQVADALFESEHAADVAYVLGKDLPRAQKLAGMTPIQQGREIGRIEAELSSVPKAKTISKAPPPVQTLGGKSGISGPDPAKMTPQEMKDYLAG